MENRVQLFITCLSEQFYPDVLEKLVGLLERLDIIVEFPQAQTCCGQPLFNSGYQDEARQLAKHWLETFSASPAPIVSPSGSCVDMVRHHYPELFPHGSPEYELASNLAARSFELSEYLVHELKVVDVGARFPHRVTYHPSCHLLRGLGLREEAKQLLSAVRDLELVTLPDEETCCGFGGVFSVIYPAVSQAMMDAKISNIIASEAEAVVACDAGCLMNIGGGLKLAGSKTKALHLIEVLASQEGVQ
jgi:L-lactate dehydrogenase complex protein LldE